MPHQGDDTYAWRRRKVVYRPRGKRRREVMVLVGEARKLEKKSVTVDGKFIRGDVVC